MIKLKKAFLFFIIVAVMLFQGCQSDNRPIAAIKDIPIEQIKSIRIITKVKM